MADRRMFAKTIIDSDAFLDMPVTSRLLYYDLAMRADDDGFVNAPKKIMRIVGATQDDLGILVLKKFVIPFDNGVIVIKHWRLHNYIRKDRYSETKYKEQKAMLELDENNAYRLRREENVPIGIPPVANMDTQDRSGKDSIEEDSIDEEKMNSLPVDSDDHEEIEEKRSRKRQKNEGPTEPSVFEIPLVDGSVYGVTQSEIDMFSSLYPAVDVPQQIRAIIGWNMANPKKRKTRSGIKRHINTWLADKQNKSRTVYNDQSKNRYTPVPAAIPDDDDENPFKR